MESVVNLSNSLLESVSNEFVRSLVHEIDWSQKLIEIRGSRGVGKTTLMLQKAKVLKENGAKVVYVSLDTPYFFSNSLVDFADEFSRYGGEYLFLDEVHRYPSKQIQSDWSLELKNIYDSYPKLKVVYSGSSILHLYKGKGDLSRRKAAYLLNGLSFREYLELNNILQYKPVELEILLKNHDKIASEINKEIRPMVYFKKYLKFGFYPFYKHNEDIYFKQLQDVINLIIDTDLPYLTSISSTAREQLKRLLGAISSTVPYVPNMHKLAGLIHVTDHRTLLKYLQLLMEAQLIYLLRADAKGNKQLQKPDKILLNNTNLIYALGISQNDVGTQRETFFLNQISFRHAVNYSVKADFLVNKKYLFEIGGRGKNKTQISGSKTTYLALDDIETGFGTTIPLWLFGFLY
jgi:uncharacterized protein